jgi:hypothetical protein
VKDEAEGLSSEEVDTQLERALSMVRLERVYKTQSNDRAILATVSAVLDRLDVLKRLDDEAVRKAMFWHWEPLCVYLALTCFDLLGQPATGWRLPREWLAEIRGRPEETASIVGTTTGIDACDAFLSAYEREFGVRNSFFRFINEVLPDVARSSLLESIWLHDTALPPQMGELPAPGETEKLRYLFETRNGYTHSGRFVGGTGNVEPPPGLGRAEETWRAREQTISATKMRTALAKDWPAVLIASVRVGLAEFLRRVPDA